MQVSAVVESDSFAIVGGQQARAMKIGHNAHAFKILSDALYGDKFRAVVREVLCNAVDAHIVAGITEPVSVTLSNTELTIQDFGPGIPDDRMIDIYATYFGSTKIQDETQTGGFGLGSKSPFAYTDHFTVTSRHKGVRRIYALSVGDDDTDGAPSVRLMASMACGDEQGVTVTVPLVQEDDKYTFGQHIEHVVEEGGMNVVKNGEKVDTRDYTELKRVGFGVVKRRGNEMRVLYGNVQYPLGTNSAIDDLVSKLNRLRPRNYSILISAPPSSLTVMPSREGIGYSPRTIKTVNALLRRAIHEIESQRGKARRDMVAEVLKNVPREMVGYALRTTRWNDQGSSEDVVVGGFNVARALEADPVDGLGGKHRFYVCAKRLYREHRRGFVGEYLTEHHLASDQVRICATKIMRIVKPASTKCKVYIRRNSFASLDLLRRKESTNRWPIVNVKHLIFAKTRDEALGFGESGYYVVASKLTPAEMDAITENAFRHGYSVSVVISAPKVQKAPAPKRVKISEDLYSPMVLNPSHHASRFGKYNPLPAATVTDPKAYISMGITRSSVHGICLKGNTDLRDLSKKITAIFPGTVIAATDKELAKLHKASVPSIEEVLIQKLRERVALHEFADAAFLVLMLGGQNHHDNSLFARRMARVSNKLGLITFGLPSMKFDPKIKALWRLAQEVFSTTEHTRQNLFDNAVEAKRFSGFCTIYQDLIRSAIEAAPPELRDRMRRLVCGQEVRSDLAHLGDLPNLMHTGYQFKVKAESREEAAFIHLIEAYTEFQRTNYNVYKKGISKDENDD